MHPTRGSIKANGIQFATLEWGSGPLVLCFHGFPDTAHTWDVVGPAVAAAGYRVVAPFLRGYAPSSRPSTDTDSRTLGEDVLALIDALGDGPTRVIGHDWGAEAVYAAVGLDPARVDRLVTIGIPPRAAVSFTPALAWAIRHFATLRLPGAERRFAANDLAGIAALWHRWSPTWKYSEADLAPVKAAFSEPGVVHAALGYYRAATPVVQDFLRAKIPRPALLIAGADDPNIAPAAFERCRPHFTGAFQVVSVRGGHFCHRESPEATITAILPFLAG